MYLKAYSVVLVYAFFTVPFMFFAKMLNALWILPVPAGVGSYFILLVGKIVKDEKVFSCEDVVILFFPIFMFGLVKSWLYVYIQNT